MKRLFLLLLASVIPIILIAETIPYDQNFEVIMVSKEYIVYGQSCTDCTIVWSVLFHNSASEGRCFEFVIIFKKGRKVLIEVGASGKIGPNSLLEYEDVTEVDYLGCEEDFECRIDKMDLIIVESTPCGEPE